MLEGVDMALWSDSGGVAVDGYGRNAIFLPGGHSRRGHCNKHFRRTWFPHLDEAVLLADRILVLGHGDAHGDAGGDGRRPEGSTIAELLPVPGDRPRDRNSADLGALRSTLLSMLGVTGH